MLLLVSTFDIISPLCRSWYQHNPDDKIELRGLNESVLWSKLDRWDYTVADEPRPPPYSLYTFFTLGESFQAFLVLVAIHSVVMLTVKIATSPEFRTRNDLFEKFVHVIQNISLATPYKDWDQGIHNVLEYRRRFRRTNIEMVCGLTINVLVSLAMLVPVWYTGE